MSSIAISGDTSGTVTIAAPAIAGTNTMTLAAGSGTLAPKVMSTAVTSTSGTSIDFTNIPSWVTRITVMFNGVSTSGSNNWLVQVGAGSVTSSGYNAYGQTFGGSSGTGSGYSAGFGIRATRGTASVLSGVMVITNLNGNIWVSQHALGDNANGEGDFGAGGITLSGVLDRVRITTAGGTDTFDAGTINIMYE